MNRPYFTTCLPKAPALSTFSLWALCLGCSASAGSDPAADAAGAASGAGASTGMGAGTSGDHTPVASGGNTSSGGATGTGGLTSTGGTASTGGAPVVGSSSPAGLRDMPLADPPAGAVHIDPTNSGDGAQDGSLEHPYDSFDDINLTANTTYAIRRGTTLNFESITINEDDVTFMSYGDGDRPILNSSASGDTDRAILSGWTALSNFTIRDVVIECPAAHSCIRMAGSNGNLDNVNTQIINVKTVGGEWGIRIFNSRNVFIDNVEVSAVEDDGMFLKTNDEVEIAYSYVHDVNTKWVGPGTTELQSPGDGIQFAEITNWHVHHNVLDRSSSGNKFCFIAKGIPGEDVHTDGVLEHNYLIGPVIDQVTAAPSGSAVYFEDGRGQIVRYNTFVPTKSASDQSDEDNGYAMFTHTPDVEFYGNVVWGNYNTVSSSKNLDLHHNTFYEVERGIRGNPTINASNNIFVMLDNEDPFDQVGTLSGANNLVVGAAAPSGSFTGDPAFVDAANGDFGLSAGSDAIDSGSDVGVASDLVGTARPQGVGFDVGAIEYVP